jgi:hypothetical protein
VQRTTERQTPPCPGVSSPRPARAAAAHPQRSSAVHAARRVYVRVVSFFRHSAAFAWLVSMSCSVEDPAEMDSTQFVLKKESMRVKYYCRDGVYTFTSPCILVLIDLLTQDKHRAIKCLLQLHPKRTHRVPQPGKAPLQGKQAA